MSSSTARPETLARLRANAARAGLRLGDDDLARIAAGAFLSNVDNFSRVVERVSSDTIPDYLKDWRDHRPTEASPAADTAAPDTTDPLDPFAPLHVVAAAIAAGAVSPVALTELMLERIGRHDPSLNAYQIVLADGARAAAREAEREIAAGRYRGPFHGVPVALRDRLALAGLPPPAPRPPALFDMH